MFTVLAGSKLFDFPVDEKTLALLDGKYRPAAEREWEKVLFDPVRPATIDADGKLTIRDLGADGSSVWPFTARASPGSPGSCSPAAGWTWGH